MGPPDERGLIVLIRKFVVGDIGCVDAEPAAKNHAIRHPVSETDARSEIQIVGLDERTRQANLVVGRVTFAERLEDG